jgi:hypothetical protein
MSICWKRSEIVLKTWRGYRRTEGVLTDESAPRAVLEDVRRVIRGRRNSYLSLTHTSLTLISFSDTHTYAHTPIHTPTHIHTHSCVCVWYEWGVCVCGLCVIESMSGVCVCDWGVWVMCLWLRCMSVMCMSHRGVYVLLFVYEWVRACVCAWVSLCMCVWVCVCIWVSMFEWVCVCM